MSERNRKKKTTPARAFAKFFGITLVCAVVGITAALAAWNHFLDQKPMDTASAVGITSNEPVEKTEQKMSILVKASGVFKKDPDFKNSKRVNILLFGNTINGKKVEGEPYSEQFGLTDTIMLGSFDPETKKFDVISVPRDTYYERPEYQGAAWQKINSVLESPVTLTDSETEAIESKSLSKLKSMANNAGIDMKALAKKLGLDSEKDIAKEHLVTEFMNRLKHDKQIKYAAKIISEVLQGVQINYYAVIDYDGAAKIIDSIGGVEINVPRNMHYTDRKQDLYINLKKGKQVLDGDKAIQFLRYRKGYREGDLGRVKAQQNFVMAAVKQSIGPNLPKVGQTILENVDSDIENRAILYLATAAISMSGDDVASHTLPGEDSYMMGGSFWIPSSDEDVVSMMREVYTGIPQVTGSAISPAAVDGDGSSADGESETGSQ
jgi:LCP family protein required for cell wall assembly